MSQKEKTVRKAPRMTQEQRAVRRNQVFFLALSVIIILSMLISLVKF